MKENFWMPGLHRKHFVLDTGCLFLCPMQTRAGAPSAPRISFWNLHTIRVRQQKKKNQKTEGLGLDVYLLLAARRLCYI